MELIDTQTALAEAYHVVIDGSVFTVVQVETLYGLPTIDAVPVVRCVDCKHRPTKRMGRSGRYLDFPDYKCPFQCDDPWYNREPPDDWFCPNGEKGAKNEKH